MTIEQVDQQIEELEKTHGHKIAAVHKGAAGANVIDPTMLLTSVCAIITIAVPILKFGKMLLFFRPKWQAVIQQIIDVAGTACNAA